MQKEHLTLLFILVLCQFGWAQEEEEDNIGTETVTVTKAYTPTISDAFKIKSIPIMNDSIALQKKKIDYSIFSVPVASTFSPAKGTASKVKKTPPPILYNSYASAGGGNPANIMAKFYTSRTIDRESGYTVGLEHNSSRADIGGVELDNFYSNSQLEGSYKNRDRDYDWGIDLGFQHQLYNWYGTPEGLFGEAPFVNSDIAIDARQNYFMGEVGAHINLEDSYFKGTEIKYRRFWDAVKSGENRVVFIPEFEFPVAEETVGIKFKVDYVNGSFENASLNNTENIQGINYSHLQVGVNPTLTMLRDDLTLNLGVNLVYGLDGERSDSNFYVYPTVTASYRLLNDVAIAYGGIEGELVQNSYYGFVEENPYVSPTLTVAPTDKQYDAYFGLRGQLFPNLSYNVKASYKAENRKPLFKLNPRNDFRTDDKQYYLGNSFEVFSLDGVTIGDDVKTFGIFGELNVDVNRNFTLGVNAEYFNYSTETDLPAWNLPDLKGSLFLDYQIGEKWYLGANLFYVGERQDFSTIAVENTPQQDFPATIIDLDSYFDANAHIGYRITDQLSVFVRGSNLANNNYQRWANFRVQGLQVLGGATYKFDF
ncbi:TonB-dependent receptor [Maribacter algarum]|uniref:TonB-dependent receptor n=1 Tax=Maribacter algarum (ex Zhang et al. 2020) TaxID=2578118 RepID=A0A5S3PSL8_9FLAO|nr:TonB-dependent receptor [Maribacter algarum]TMM57981.1 TonB-dependent receptor [Maribacter algarum]